MGIFETRGEHLDLNLMQKLRLSLWLGLWIGFWFRLGLWIRLTGTAYLGPRTRSPVQNPGL